MNVKKYLVGLLVAGLVIQSGCKKSQEHGCELCPCVSNAGLTYTPAYVDSATFSDLILGDWYLRQQNDAGRGTCQGKCFCDSSYIFHFAADGTLTMRLPDNTTQTTTFNFLSNSNQIDMRSGTFIIAGDTSHPGVIFHTSNYMTLDTQSFKPDVYYAPVYVLHR